jgi:hypothetical protein
MNWTTIAVAGVFVAAAGAVGAAQSQDATFHSDIIGTWSVQVTLRDCVTNTPIGPPFSSLVTFHAGGTLSEAAAPRGFAPGQRTPGHGRWSRQPGQTFLQEMVNLIVFDTPPNIPGSPTFNPSLPAGPGFFAGMQTVTQNLRLTADGELVSSGGNVFYDNSGAVYRTGCSTAVGRRFE